MNLGDTLAPSCEQITVAGGIRRRQGKVFDIQLVAVPRYAPDLLGERCQCLLASQLVELQSKRVLIIEKIDVSYAKFKLVDGDVDVHLHTADLDNWGWILFLHTGPYSFTKRALYPRELCTADGEAGILPPGYYVAAGYLWHHGRKLETPDEETVFRILGIDPITPPRRK